MGAKLFGRADKLFGGATLRLLGLVCVHFAVFASPSKKKTLTPVLYRAHDCGFQIRSLLSLELFFFFFCFIGSWKLRETRRNADECCSSYK